MAKLNAEQTRHLALAQQGLVDARDVENLAAPVGAVRASMAGEALGWDHPLACISID